MTERSARRSSNGSGECNRLASLQRLRLVLDALPDEPLI